MKNLKVTVNGIAYEVQIEEVGPQAQPALVNSGMDTTEIKSKPSLAVNQSSTRPASNGYTNGSDNGNKKGLLAPMPGLIKQVKVTLNQQVQAGDIILVLEAMKLENEIRAKKAGAVKDILVEEGQIVGQGAVLVVIE